MRSMFISLRFVAKRSMKQPGFPGECFFIGSKIGVLESPASLSGGGIFTSVGLPAHFSGEPLRWMARGPAGADRLNLGSRRRHSRGFPMTGVLDGLRLNGDERCESATLQDLLGVHGAVAELICRFRYASGRLALIWLFRGFIGLSFKVEFLHLAFFRQAEQLAVERPGQECVELAEDLLL